MKRPKIAHNTQTQTFMLILIGLLFFMIVGCDSDENGTVSSIVGSKGGVVILPDEDENLLARVEIPPDTLVDETTITIRHSSFTGQPPNGFYLASAGIYNITSSKEQPLSPVTITIKIPENILINHEYRIFWRESETDNWQPLPSEKDLRSSSVLARVDHLSSFGVFMSDQSTETKIPSPAVVIKFYNGLNTPGDVNVALKNIADACIPTVIMPVRNDDEYNAVENKTGKAFYNSNVISDQDDLLIFERALSTAQDLGLNVYAWVPVLQDQLKVSENMNEVAAYHLLSENDVCLNSAIPSEKFMCPCASEVQEYLKSIIEEISLFPVNGIILDYTRYDTWGYSFSPSCRLKYSERYNRDLESDYCNSLPNANNYSCEGRTDGENWTRFKNFREDIIVELVSSLTQVTDKPVGSFVFPRGCFYDWDLWYEDVGQNLPAFLENGISWVLPMVYPEHRPDDWDRPVWDAIQTHVDDTGNWISSPTSVFYTFDDAPRGEAYEVESSDYDKVRTIADNYGGAIFYDHDGAFSEDRGKERLQEISRAFDLNCINDQDGKPQITPIDDDTIKEGQTYLGPTPNLKSDVSPVIWSLVSAPTGMVVTAETGAVSWPDARVGDHEVRIRATNSQGSDEESWVLTVALIKLPLSLQKSEGSRAKAARVKP